jgi:hypothetical protein
MEAVEKGRVSEVHRSIKEGADVNDKDDLGNTALMKAAAKGHESVVVALLAKGARPNERNEKGETALMKAAEMGHVSIMKFLLKPEAITNNAAELLKKAGVDAKPGEIAALVLGETRVDVKDAQGQTALYKAALHNQTEAIALLASTTGADRLTKDNEGHSPLMIAVANGHFDAAKAILTVISNFAYTGTSCRLQTDRKGQTPLMMAAAKGDKDMVAELVNVPWFEYSNEPPEVRRKHMLEYLDLVDKAGKTALDYAKEGNHKDVVQVLLKAAGKEEDKGEKK